MQGLEAQLLRQVVAEERGELEEAKERLLLSLAADTRQLQDLQDRILKLLKVTPPTAVSPYLRQLHQTCATILVSPYLCQHIYILLKRHAVWQVGCMCSSVHLLQKLAGSIA